MPGQRCIIATDVTVPPDGAFATSNRSSSSRPGGGLRLTILGIFGLDFAKIAEMTEESAQ
jgi:hypothetical protein